EAGLAAARAVAGDREAVRLVAHTLHQEQPLAAARQNDRLLAPRQIDFLKLFRQPADRHAPEQPDRLQNLDRYVQLPLAAVDDQQVRQQAPRLALILLAGRGDRWLLDRVEMAAEAARQRLAHRLVIVRSLVPDSLDVEAAVLAFTRDALHEHHAAGDDRRTLRRADVEALDPVGRVRQVERGLQLAQRRLLLDGVAGPLRAQYPQLFDGGLGRKLDQLALVAALRNGQLDLTPAAP